MILGLIKQKGGVFALSPERFCQIPVKHLQPYDILRKEMLGYAISGFYWVIAKDDENYVRVPFARNEFWFKALTSDVEYSCIARLPQIYIIGQA